MPSSWFGDSIRDCAVEADLVDYYDYFYPVLSSYTHADALTRSRFFSLDASTRSLTLILKDKPDDESVVIDVSADLCMFVFAVANKACAAGLDTEINQWLQRQLADPVP